MFSKTITSSSVFLMLPASTQNLYFHLGMNADDDGFCEHFMVMRMTESKPDDLKLLQVKNFVKVFDDKVLVIVDWKENNYLRLDRYTPSKYMEIYNREMAQLGLGKDKISSGIPLVYQEGDERSTQVRSGQVRSGEVIKKEKDPLVSVDYLSSIPANDMREFVSRFIASEKEIKSKAEDLKLYCERKGRLYRNYKSFLLNALKRDFKEREAARDGKYAKL
jgi:hypothetical protein